jgi:diguanylate cyclase (GGDEF)-like protein
MATPLHLLLLEDDTRDAELIIEHLRADGYELDWHRVDTEADYLAGLARQPDLVLADYSQPLFDAGRALKILKARRLDIPFIIVSGCIGEDVAVRCIREGADDYLLKDRLARLGQAVAQALDRKRLREEKRQAEERLFHEAHHDALTGLPNRALFLDRLERVLQRYKRDQTSLFALLLVDLDGFKVINDSLGHKAGDQVLIDVSRCLAEHVRSSDTVARLAGDEFAVLLDNVKAVTNGPHVAQRIQQAFTKPFTVDGRDIFITLSIGITASTGGYDRADDLLRDAAIAMDRAKEAGKSRFTLFDPVMHEQAMRRLKLEAELRHAVDREQFRLFYHPIVSLTTGRIAGFEALLRWLHPQQGLMAPDLYLPVAEEIGLVIPIGEWVLREACRQTRTWQQAFPHQVTLSVAVNLSAKQFAHRDLTKTVTSTLTDTELEPSSLKIEITETVMMDNADQATATLLDLKSSGVQTCVDDFGTGYSSLSYLQRFPVDYLKIDRSFINRTESDQKSLEIVRTIIQLAHQLGRMVIAEGVETAAQLARLRSLGCEYGQGYYFAKPLGGPDAASILKQNRTW